MGWREGFLFGGGNLISRPISRRRRELFLKLFNYGSIVLTWRNFEPRRGEKEWERVDEVAAWLEENYITAKGHPLMWLGRISSPDWVLKGGHRQYEAVGELIQDRAYEIAKHYKGIIDMFDVVNEAHDWNNIFDYSDEQLVELSGLICDVVRDANPEVIRVINHVWEWGQYVASGRYSSFQGLQESTRPLMSPSKYLEKCLEANIGFEAIGLQVHNPVHDMFEINQMLDRYARFRKPIHITELGYPSAPVQEEAVGQRSNVGDYIAAASTGVTIWGHPHNWHAPFNEAVQADWYEQFYTLCYSKPCVTAVTTWSWQDVGSALGLSTIMARARGERPRGWPPYTGFFKSDLTSKLSYYRLKNLIDSWKSQRIENGA
jgi:GH35 family endo-1,4-beta-xylanase